MGKRKSARKPGAGKTKMAPLDKTFRCLFCQHTGTVTCKMDQKNKVGRIDCKDCGQNFSADINHLTEPIDVYSEWIDACEDVNPPEAERSASPPRAAGGALSRKRAAPRTEEEEEEDLPDLRLRKKGKEAAAVEEEEEEEEEEDLPDLSLRRKTVVDDDEE